VDLARGGARTKIDAPHHRNEIDNQFALVYTAVSGMEQMRVRNGRDQCIVAARRDILVVPESMASDTKSGRFGRV
jgi:hypothetical protein